MSKRAVEAQIELPPGPDSARRARAFVGETLRTWSCDDEVISSASLLASELVTNAVLHAGAATRLVLHQAPGSVRVEVHDSDERLPVRRQYGRDAMTGRGLHIVEAVATRWGAEPMREGGRGKRVWFELRTA